MIASRKMENLERTAAEFAGHCRATVLPFRCHVGKKEQIEATVAAAEERFGTVDIMVNNGATNLEQGPALDVTDEAVMKMVEINVLSSVRFLRLVVPKMIEKGGGSIINIASIAGLRPQLEGLLYSLTKSGADHDDPLVGLRMGQAQRPRQRHLSGPGAHRLQFVLLEERRGRGTHPAEPAHPPPGRNRDIGGIALYLASDESTWVSGTNLGHRRRRNGALTLVGPRL